MYKPDRSDHFEAPEGEYDQTSCRRFGEMASSKDEILGTVSVM